jgi:serine protease inhibitor ecotin
MGDACNTTYYRGSIEEHPVQGAEASRFYKLAFDPRKSATTLKGCLQDDKALRTTEIVTDLKSLKPFQNNIVIYVPKNVDVSATVWKQAQRLDGRAP